MKVKLNQEMQDEFGMPVIEGGRPALTLRDVIVSSILAPVREEEEKPKQEKWEIFKKIRDVKVEVDLKAEEITIIKKCIAKFQGQLFMGEAHEMLEGVYVRMKPTREKEETPKEKILN